MRVLRVPPSTWDSSRTHDEPVGYKGIDPHSGESDRSRSAIFECASRERGGHVTQLALESTAPWEMRPRLGCTVTYRASHSSRAGPSRAGPYGDTKQEVTKSAPDSTRRRFLRVFGLCERYRSSPQDCGRGGCVRATESAGGSTDPPSNRRAASSTSSRPARIPATVGVTSTCG